jgi:hypothetical protein
MARMIPSFIDPSTPSPGEKEVFERLERDPATEEWIALHSLDLTHHVRAIVGELDFLALVPGKGALAIEVKACRSLTRSDGLWFYGSEERGDPRGPFKQASEAMHSVRALVERRSDLRRVPFWSAVVFPYIPFDEESEEWHPWQVVDARGFRSRPIGELLEGVLDSARAFLQTRPSASWFDPSAGEPTPRQCEQIAKLLRPSFEVGRTVTVVRKERQEELARFTEEQFEALDAMAANDRVAFEGPAGTGKTFLAIEAARRAAAEGRRVLLVCFNHLLGEWLRAQLPRGSTVTVKTLHAYMLGIAGLRPSDNEGREFWEERLPSATIEALLRGVEHASFDELIVDEAQDILRDDYLDVLDLSLAGGLAAGRWMLFGDFERQALYGSAGLSLDTFCTMRGGSPSRFHLGVNCRNVPRVVELVRLLGGLGAGYSRVRRPDNGFEPRLKFYGSNEEQCELLAHALTELYEDGFAGADIVVLSPRSAASCAERITETPWRDRLNPIREAASGQIGFTTIQAFKGMEAPAIVVTDVTGVEGPAMESLFYVAMTRATDRLVLLMDESLRPTILTLLSRDRMSAEAPVA